MKEICGYLGCIFVGLVALIIIYKLIVKDIDLRTLLSEKTSLGQQASMARFQLLIFIFVIAVSYLRLMDKNTDGKLPDIPNGVLTLLGISASTYAVGKGIQHSSSSVGGDDDGGGDNAQKRQPVQPGGQTVVNVHTGGQASGVAVQNPDKAQTPEKKE